MSMSKQEKLILARKGYCYKCLNNGIKRLKVSKELMFCIDHTEEIIKSHTKMLSEN